MSYVIQHRTTGGFIGRDASGDVRWRLTRHREDAHVFDTWLAAEAARLTFDSLATTYAVTYCDDHDPTGRSTELVPAV